MFLAIVLQGRYGIFVKFVKHYMRNAGIVKAKCSSPGASEQINACRFFV